MADIKMAEVDPVSEIKAMTSYSIEPGTEGLLEDPVEQEIKQHNGQTFGPNNQISFMLRGGEYAMDGANSYFTFNLKLTNAGTNPRLNPLGSCSLIRRLQVESVSGVRILDMDGYNQYVRLMENSRKGELHARMGAYDNRNSNQYNPNSLEWKRDDLDDGNENKICNNAKSWQVQSDLLKNANVGLNCELHLHYTIFKDVKLLPLQFMGPLKITLYFDVYRNAILEDAINSSAISTYTISNFALQAKWIKFSEPFTEKMQAAIQERAGVGGIPLVQDTYFYQQAVLNGADYFSVEINKSASNVRQIVSMLQPQELANDQVFPYKDRFDSSPMGVKKYQMNIGQTLFPLQPLEFDDGHTGDYSKFFRSTNRCFMEPGKKSSGLSLERYASQPRVMASTDVTTKPSPGWVKITPSNRNLYIIFAPVGRWKTLATDGTSGNALTVGGVRDESIYLGEYKATTYSVGPPETGTYDADATNGTITGFDSLVAPYFEIGAGTASDGATARRIWVQGPMGNIPIVLVLPLGWWKWDDICDMIQKHAILPRAYQPMNPTIAATVSTSDGMPLHAKYTIAVSMANAAATTSDEVTAAADLKIDTDYINAGRFQVSMNLNQRHLNKEGNFGAAADNALNVWGEPFFTRVFAEQVTDSAGQQTGMMALRFVLNQAFWAKGGTASDSANWPSKGRAYDHVQFTTDGTKYRPYYVWLMYGNHPYDTEVKGSDKFHAPYTDNFLNTLGWAEQSLDQQCVPVFIDAKSDGTPFSLVGPRAYYADPPAVPAAITEFRYRRAGHVTGIQDGCWVQRPRDFCVGTMLQDAIGVPMSGRPTSLDAVPVLKFWFDLIKDKFGTGKRSAITTSSWDGGSTSATQSLKLATAASAIANDGIRLIVYMLYTQVVMIGPNHTLTIRE